MFHVVYPERSLRGVHPELAEGLRMSRSEGSKVTCCPPFFVEVHSCGHRDHNLYVLIGNVMSRAGLPAFYWLESKSEAMMSTSHYCVVRCRSFPQQYYVRSLQLKPHLWKNATVRNAYKGMLHS